MFKDWVVRGDCHGDFTWLNARMFRILNPKDYAIIILGDVGFNSGNTFRDNMKKEYASQFGYSIYCVRGNHEVRPDNVEDMKRIWDNNVQANVWYEPAYPLIRYFDNLGKWLTDHFTRFGAQAVVLSAVIEKVEELKEELAKEKNT